LGLLGNLAEQLPMNALTNDKVEDLEIVD
jgi:hypothetical protein